MAATAVPVLQLGAPGGAALAQAVPLTVQSQPAAQNLVLKARRLSDSVEVLIEGTGPAPVLQQSNSGGLWFGQLSTSQPLRLGAGSQRLALPEAGIESITLQGSGGSYQIQVKPMGGAPLARPLISADGRNLLLSFSANPLATTVTGRLDLNTPGRVPQVAFAPPLQPRAVAPPLGDMAVGSMVLRNRSFVNVSGPRVTLTLRNAPAKDALMALAQLGNYGFVYVEGQSSGSGLAGASAATAALPPPSVSIAFRNESYARAINSVLLASGLQGKLEGSMIFAGPNVASKTFGSQISKIYRLNQASAGSAADYLASLGATINKVSVITNTVSQGTSQANQVAGGASTQQTQTQEVTTTETYGASTGPLKGLTGTTDSRLQTITLVGDSGLVSVAENYLRQLDLRQRQVALSVKILDVTLDNDAAIQNSFAFRYGNNFIVNDNGKLLGAFGSQLPPTSNDFRRGVPDDLTQEVTSGTAAAPGTITTTGTNLPGLSTTTTGSVNGAPVSGNQILDAFRRNPGVNFPRDNFYNFIQASIQSQTTKVLASPTLILSENQDELRGGAETAATLATAGGSSTGGSSSVGVASIGRPRANESFITVGEQVITNFTVTVGTNGNGNSCQPQFGIAGLTFGARVSKIDDNGFVTFSLSPQVSAVTKQQPVQGCGTIDILSVRRLDSGSSRVRDGQTLILTGVISDSDTQTVTKWPILGDIPLIGQFFRASNGSRKKRELVILVTPRIINDTEGGTFGYGYNPSTPETRQLLSSP
ncbi:type II secretion system protein GspD [Cyanobium sp. Morenito 9A2]|uniref:type II secretion system protein GspD n=1 Tax=Cyanobium sp. Morenito 9A2 TaxID=2823718 RepID=UPI0020CB6FE8|nr:general secretion pathway protein GspD [Cyanobium sp. Morenito 9A2]